MSSEEKDFNRLLIDLSQELENFSGHPTLIADTDQRTVAMSDNLLQLFKAHPSQNHTSIYEQIIFRLSDFQKKELRRKVRKAISQKSSVYFELSIALPGSKDECILGVSLLNNTTIRPGHRILTARIINKTEHKRIRLYEQSNKNQLKRILNSAPDPVVITSINGDILDFNPATLEFLGLEEKEIRGEKLWKFTKSGKENEIKNIISKTLQYSYSKQNNIVFSTRHKSVHYSEVSSSVVYEDDSPHFISFFIRDVSANIIYQKQLEKEKRKAQESDRLKTAFLANMSHEIRTPMNAIIGFSELLDDPDLTRKEQHEYVDLINTNSTELLNLIDDIIDVAKIEAGQIQIRKTTCPLKQIIGELVKQYREKVQRENKDIKIYISVPQKYESLETISDAYRLRQILKNLISNAVKFTNKGSVTIGYEVITRDEKPYIRLFTRDTGIGIPADKLESIFERFRQVEETHVRNYNGAGLGLTLSKKLTEMLNGEIGVESMQGKGSEFYFTIPLEIPEYQKENKEKALKSRPYDWINKNIVVAEDIEANYLYIEAALMQTQANVIWATDGDIATDKCLSDQNIDLVLMDIQMPGLNGYQATKVIKKQRPGLPIIALTAFATENEQEKSIAAGCDDFLTKPIKPQKLLDTMNKYLK